MTPHLTSDEALAIDLLASIPVVPDHIVNARGEVDERASEELRRPALNERETLRARARALSSAVVDAFDAMARGTTLASYTMRQRVAIEASCAQLADVAGTDATALYLMTIGVRERAVEIQTWARAGRNASEEAA